MKTQAAQHKQDQRDRRAEQGFVSKTYWVHKKDVAKADEAIKNLPNADTYKRKPYARKS